MSRLEIRSESHGVLIDTEGCHIIQVSKGADGLLWQGDRDSWGSCPILFPFVGRLCQGRYLAEGKVYGADIHGFISKRRFSVDEAGGSSAHLSYTSDGGDYAVYPYRFRFEAAFHAFGDSLEVEFCVANLDRKTMHFGLGLHPGFLADDPEYGNYYIQFDTGHLSEFVMEPSRLFSGRMVRRELDSRRLRLSHQMFDNDALIFKDWGGRASLRNDRRPGGIRIETDDFPVLTVWSRPGQERPFVCVEPCTSVPGREGELLDISQKEDYFHLGPGRRQKFGLVMAF